MAGNYQISVKDEASARRWLEMVQAINEDYRVAMEEASHTLDNIQNFADGTIVDEFVGFGSSLLTATTQVFEGIDSIADTVADILTAVNTFVEEAKGFISTTMDKLFG